MLCHMLSWHPGTWHIRVVFVSWLHCLPLWGSAGGPLWPWALYYWRFCDTSQEFQPMASQLSKKAAIPLAKILATCRNNVSNTGPCLFLPPAGAWVISAIKVALLFTILSNNFPMLLASVMPLSFEHFPWVPLPLFSRVMFPFSQWGGISLFLSILLYIIQILWLYWTLWRFCLGYCLVQGISLFWGI